MKMTVKQWTLLISTMEKAKDNAEEYYKALCAENARDDVQRDAWESYSKLADIVCILNNAQI